MPWTMKTGIFGAIVISMLLALVACGGDDDGSDNPSNSGPSSTPSASTTESSTPIPLLEDFPSPPGAAAVTSSTNEAGLKVLTLTTTEPLDDVVAFYEDALTDPPWNATGRS